MKMETEKEVNFIMPPKKIYRLKVRIVRIEKGKPSRYNGVKSWNS